MYVKDQGRQKKTPKMAGQHLTRPVSVYLSSLRLAMGTTASCLSLFPSDGLFSKDRVKRSRPVCSSFGPGDYRGSVSLALRKATRGKA